MNLDDIQPILFLDIDGVLNVAGSKSREPTEQLHRVIRETNTRIVLSSMWRKMGLTTALTEIRNQLGYTGPNFIGATPDLKGAPRGQEIAAWLASSPNPVGCWAVVDDDPDMPFVRHRFVQTNPRIGLDEVAADRLIELLTRWEVTRG